MEKIYEQLNDLHVAAVKVYAKANDSYAYYDSAKTIKVSSADLLNLYRKGRIVIVDGSVEYVPISYGISSSVGTLTYVKTDGTTATTAVLATLKSSEYTAPTITFSTQPSAASVTAGSISGSLTVAASSSDSSTVTYAWYSNTANSNSGGTAVTGETSASLTIPTTLTEGTYYYYCKATSTTAGNAVSNVAVVTVAGD